MKRRSQSLETSEAEYEIILCPVEEDHVEFQKRMKIVHSIIAKMIVVGKKRGRPSERNMEYEDAA